ncbi:MAG: semialdehyde dehydrogenase [Bryobacterales bacterium]|nr:semialdehyde dehydrogenase [Bryobacterales bacterium]
MSDSPIPSIVLMGAGGKMGLRLSANLARTAYPVRHVEVSERGREALAARGISVVDQETAFDGADAVILAIPDKLIGPVSHQIAPRLRSGALLVVLDAAAPHAGEMPDRDDLSIFVTHPCHPPVIHDETAPEAQLDFFGGVHARQHIVCALMRGPEEAYTAGEAIARAIFAPVMRAHRCTVEQMAILEPVLSETVAATCMMVMREAVDEAERRGVPRQAALDFLIGHLKVEIGIAFELFEGARFSDGALQAIERAKVDLFQPDWKKVFEPDAVRASVASIVAR